jgi:hypothetical protein
MHLQVITCADFHPSHCSLFAFSSSKGCIRLGDLRSAALCDRSAKMYQETEPEVNKETNTYAVLLILPLLGAARQVVCWHCVLLCRPFDSSM